VSLYIAFFHCARDVFTIHPPIEEVTMTANTAYTKEVSKLLAAWTTKISTKNGQQDEDPTPQAKNVVAAKPNNQWHANLR
jgi:hypothetical protein